MLKDLAVVKNYFIKPKFALRIIALLIILIIVVSVSNYYKWKKSKLPRYENILLIIVETLRAKHLSCYGYDRNTSPNIDSLARDGVLFKRNFSQSPWTLPSISSIFTSLYSSVHGAVVHGDILSDKYFTLAEALRSKGFKTQGFISGHFARKKYGLAQGFDEYNEKNVLGQDSVSSGKLTNDAIKWIGNNKDNKFFLFLQYYDPHYNYTYNEEFSFYKEKTQNIYNCIPIEKIRKLAPILSEEDKKTLLGYYDSEISVVDDNLGKLFNYLKQNNLYDSTVIVFTADHGEEFGEKGYYGHTFSVANSVLHIPLIFHVPGNKHKGRIVENVVSSIDIYPTILDLLDMEIPQQIQGYSLMEYIVRVGSKYPVKESFAELFLKNKQVSLQTKKWKVVHQRLSNGQLEEHLYDIENDPYELRDVSNKYNAEKDKYSKLLIEKQKKIDINKDLHQKRTLSDSEIEHIKSLGYMN